MKFVRITELDYEQYFKSYSQIEFSIHIKNQKEPKYFVKSYAKEIALSEEIFLQVLKQSDVEMYFIKDCEENIIGISVMQIMGEFCYIDMFAVFEKERGLGSKAFSILKDMLKSKSIRYIRFTCPFAGAQYFWKKQGFSVVRNCLYELEI